MILDFDNSKVQHHSKLQKVIKNLGHPSDRSRVSITSSSLGAAASQSKMKTFRRLPSFINSLHISFDQINEKSSPAASSLVSSWRVHFALIELCRHIFCKLPKNIPLQCFPFHLCHFTDLHAPFKSARTYM